MRGLQSFEPQAYAIIDGLIDRFIDDGEVELATQFSTPLTVLVFVELMGIAGEDIPQVTSWVDDTIEAMGAGFGLVEPDRLAELMASGAEFRRYLLRPAEDRRRNGRDDMLTHLVPTPWRASTAVRSVSRSSRACSSRSSWAARRRPST